MQNERSLKSILWGAVVAAALFIPATSADARCRTVTQTHNGTDFFYSDGAAGTAIHKINIAVDEFKQKTGIKKVRISNVRTSCGDWFMKYGLPHKHCVAKATVCY
jgi:hypothetical protein